MTPLTGKNLNFHVTKDVMDVLHPKNSVPHDKPSPSLHVSVFVVDSPLFSVSVFWSHKYQF